MRFCIFGDVLLEWLTIILLDPLERTWLPLFKSNFGLCFWETDDGALVMNAAYSTTLPSLPSLMTAIDYFELGLEGYYGTASKWACLFFFYTFSSIFATF